jgi:hypothetical protein
MPSRIVNRDATAVETAYLEQLLLEAPTTGRRLKQGAENALVLWAASLLGLVVVWLGLAWLARKFFSMEFGFSSEAAVWIFGIAIPACLVYAVISSARWIKGWRDYRPLLRADISGRKVEEEHYVFTEAKRFQEPEHGGLIYFLRTPENKVFTLFDHESQDLGVQDADPLQSSFVPRQNLVIARAPGTRFVISKVFTGPPLEAGEPSELAAAPKHWPEDETYSSVAWTEIHSRFGSGKSAALGSANGNPA